MSHFHLSSSPAASGLFYVQAKGLHAGRPLAVRIPNSYAVTQAPPHGFQLCRAAYLAGAFRRYLRGSCVPFVILPHLAEVLNAYAERIGPDRAALLERIALMEQLRDLRTRQAASLDQAVRLLSQQL